MGIEPCELTWIYDKGHLLTVLTHRKEPRGSVIEETIKLFRRRGAGEGYEKDTR